MDICHHSFGTIVKRTEVFTQGMERASSGEIPLQNMENISKKRYGHRLKCSGQKKANNEA